MVQKGKYKAKNCRHIELVMGNDIRDSTGTNEEQSSLKLSVYSTFISKLDKTYIEFIKRP